MDVTNKLKGDTPYKPMPVPKRWFPIIEYALGIKLNYGQCFKLSHPESEWPNALKGQTFVHCILVALSIGPPLEIEQASDYGDGTMRYKYTHFINTYKYVAETLEWAGFNVRQVGNVGGWKLLRW